MVFVTFCNWKVSLCPELMTGGQGEVNLITRMDYAWRRRRREVDAVENWDYLDGLCAPSVVEGLVWCHATASWLAPSAL